MDVLDAANNFVIVTDRDRYISETSHQSNAFEGDFPRVTMTDSTWSPWVPGDTLHNGAEAVVTSGYWLGDSAVLKKRVTRGYRHPKLDESLTRQIIFAEARILSRLNRVGVQSPLLLAMDPYEGWLMMSMIEGPSLSAALNDGVSDQAEFMLGAALRQLHSLGISHGDVTTLNAILTEHGVTLVDFGLGRLVAEIEHQGLDLHSIYECLSAHHSDRPDAMDRVLEGYRDKTIIDNYDPSDVVLRFEEIKGRVRYHA